MKPPGSRPGINNFATIPTNKPKIIHPIMVDLASGVLNRGSNEGPAGG
jgi:hypothetical protein